MVSLFNRFQSPLKVRGKKGDMGSCPEFDTHMGGIFQHRNFVKADDINSIKDLFTFNPSFGLDDLFSSKISCNS